MRYSSLLLASVVCCFLSACTTSRNVLGGEVWSGEPGNTFRYDFDGNFLDNFDAPGNNSSLAVVGNEIWSGDSPDIWRYDFAANLLGRIRASGLNLSLTVVGNEVWSGEADVFHRYDFQGTSLGTISAQGPNNAVVVIPEPSTLRLIFLAWLCLCTAIALYRN